MQPDLGQLLTVLESLEDSCRELRVGLEGYQGIEADGQRAAELSEQMVTLLQLAIDARRTWQRLAERKCLVPLPLAVLARTY